MLRHHCGAECCDISDCEYPGTEGEASTVPSDAPKARQNDHQGHEASKTK